MMEQQSLPGVLPSCYEIDSLLTCANMTTPRATSCHICQAPSSELYACERCRQLCCRGCVTMMLHRQIFHCSSCFPVLPTFRTLNSADNSAESPFFQLRYLFQIWLMTFLPIF